MFTALLIPALGADPVLTELPETDLPPGDVTVAVEYSCLNYKDGMILNHLGKLARNFPHVPGINLAGRVIASQHPHFQPGDPIIAAGNRLGEVRWGGYATMTRLDGNTLVPLPPGLTTRRAMAIGTAGFAAMQAIVALEAHGLTPANEGEVLVTGAAGGVGSIAIAILAHLGYRIAAATGRTETHPYLRRLGATTLLDRTELAAPPERPLEHQRWAAVIDNVGGSTLARALGQLHTGASLAAIGMAGGNTFTASVLPLLLRGNNLLGIDSTGCPMAHRLPIWQRLATDLPADLLDSLTTEATLADLPALAKQILAGHIQGRVVVNPNR